MDKLSLKVVLHHNLQIKKEPKFKIGDEVWVLGVNKWGFTRIQITKICEIASGEYDSVFWYNGLEMGLILEDGAVRWRAYSDANRDDIKEHKLFSTKEEAASAIGCLPI